MTLSKTLVATAAVTLLLGVPSADAQRRGGNGGGANRGGSASGGGGQSRVGGGGGGQSRGGASRAGGPPAGRAPRGGTIAPRSYSSRSYSSGAYASRPYSYGGSRGYEGGPRGGAVVGRAAPRVYGSGGFRGSSVRFDEPYYSFRPRVSFGFGLRVGFPITSPYSYGYYDPYYAPYGYSYGYSSSYPYPPYDYSYSSPRYPTYPAPAYPQSAYPSSSYPSSAYPQRAYPPSSGSVSVQPGQGQAGIGGMSFEIAPPTAELVVDGAVVGTVGEFTPTTRPLGLTPGLHRVEVRAPGYQTMDFDVDIVSGQVIPYQGAMQR